MKLLIVILAIAGAGCTSAPVCKNRERIEPIFLRISGYNYKLEIAPVKERRKALEEYYESIVFETERYYSNERKDRDCEQSKLIF